MASPFIPGRFNFWVLPAALAIGVLLVVIVVWSITHRSDSTRTPAVEWHAPADTHKETSGMIASVKKEVNHVAPVTVFKMPEPQPLATPTPTQQDLQRTHDIEERRLHAYSSGGLVSVTHAGSTLELGSRDGDLHSAGLLSTSGTSHQVRLEGAAPAFTIMEGTTLKAQLLTDINSTIDVPIKAQLLEPALDSLTQRHVVMPAGTICIGKYGTNVGQEQDSVRIEWTRLILPDTSSMDIPSMVAGASDLVDRHLFKRFAMATVLGLISAGGSVAGTMTYGGGAYGYQPNGASMAKQQLIQGMSQQVGSQGQQMVQGDMNTPTTLKIRKGTIIEVMSQADLVFPHAYAEQMEVRK